jgi:Putative bacterial sensory transduction regulator
MPDPAHPADPAASGLAAVDVVDAYLRSLPGGARRVGHAEWGLSIPAETLGGPLDVGISKPLDVGVSISDGLLRVKAPALGPGHELDPWMLLWWNRQTRHVRFGSTRSREIWVHADLPASAVDEHALDRLLGLVVEAVATVRGM